jgi:hypothetical protein
MLNLKLGRKPRTYDPRIPHWSSLRLAAPQPSPPPAHFWEHGSDNPGSDNPGSDHA